MDSLKSRVKHLTDQLLNTSQSSSLDELEKAKQKISRYEEMNKALAKDLEEIRESYTDMKKKYHDLTLLASKEENQKLQEQ